MVTRQNVRYLLPVMPAAALLSAAWIVSLPSRWLRSAPGSIERCAAQMGGTPTPLGLGRGGARLGLALHVFRALLGPRPA